MCGPAAPSPQQQQTQITELPEWARPSAQRVLAKGEALTAQPYQTYDANRIAGFSPLQQQAFQGAQQLGPTQQTAMGSNLAAASGLGALGTGYRAGRFSGGQFTPMAAGQYMSPFIEQAMAPQLREAQRSSDIMGQQNAAKAAQMGAFGGSRQGLMEAERQRNLGMQLGDIRGRGYQTAYEQAAGQFNQDMARRMQAQQLGEQSRQFGANLGLQGLQTGLQAAGQLGALGQQQFAQQQGAIQAQSAAGAQQQALEQQGLTQAYQDFLNQQNYPYKQLGFMSDMIRGMPLGQQSTSSIYQAPPSALQSIGTLGLGAYGINQLFGGGKKDGGLIDSYAGDRGSVTSEEFVMGALSRLSEPQLAQAERIAIMNNDLERLDKIREERASRASERSGMASAYNILPSEFQNNIVSAAGGGIVAFSGKDENQIVGLSPEFGGEAVKSEELKPLSDAEIERIADYYRSRNKTLSYAEILDLQAGRTAPPIMKERKIAATPPVKQPTPEERIVIDEAPAAGKTSSAAPAATPAAAAAPIANTGLNELLATGRQIASMQPTPAPDEEAFIRKSMETRSKFLGENPAIKAMQEMISERKAGREEALAKGKGISALIAAGALSQGNNFMRALGNTSRAFAESYKDVLSADQAERKAIQEAQIKLADSQYKQRVGDYDGAKADYKEHLNLLQKADKFKFDKLKATSDVQYHAGTLENQKSQIDATKAAHAASADPSVVKVAKSLMNNDPKLTFEQAMRKASGYLLGEFKTTSAMNAKLEAQLFKIDDKYRVYENIPKDKPMYQNMMNAKKREIEQAYKLYGQPQDSAETLNPQGFAVVGKRPG